jgi:23S rRNA (cytosine1962-C5)-methyltransferase
MLLQRLSAALSARQVMLFPDHAQVLRLFNGFYEGCPGLVVDLYGGTLVVGNHAHPSELLENYLAMVFDFYRQALPWLTSGLLKRRHAIVTSQRRGVIAFGDSLTDIITEHGVKYALDLTLNQDSSFYLDTRNLRKYLIQNMAGKSVLNCFAYTGTLGIAAMAGGARKVIQTDLNKAALALARQSKQLNTFPGLMETLPMDFFKAVGHFKQRELLFDCVILDPPLYSSTPQGTVDLLHNWLRLINKVRPLVAHEGKLIAINNALYLPGSAMMQTLEALQATGFVQLEQLIPVPEDMTGFPRTVHDQPPVDPSPFNHPTKIAVLHITRKDNAIATH